MTARVGTAFIGSKRLTRHRSSKPDGLTANGSDCFVSYATWPDPSRERGSRFPHLPMQSHLIDGGYQRETSRPSGTSPPARGAVPPTEVREWRAKVRLYKDLGDVRTNWVQRVRATCFHQSLPARRSAFSPEGRAELLGGDGLSPAGGAAGGRRVASNCPPGRGTCGPARRGLRFWPSPRGMSRSLVGLYGVGHLTSEMIWAEMGDTRRFPLHARSYATPGLTSRSILPTTKVPGPPGPARARTFMVGAVRGGQVRR